MANRSNTFLLKRSNVLGKIPVLSGLTLGELALNTADAKLYTLYTEGLTGATEVREIGWNRLSISGGTITGDILVTGSVSATTYYGDGSQLSGISTDNFYVTGGTYSNGTLTLERQNGSVVVTGITNNNGGGGGGSSGSLFYFNLSVPQSPYREISETPVTAIEQTSGVTIGAGLTSTIASFLTPSGSPNITNIPAGIWSFFLHSYKQNNNASFNIFCEVYVRTTGGTETLLISSDPEPITSNSPNPSMQVSDVFYSGTSLNSSDRILVKVRSTNTSNQSHDVTFVTEGTRHYSYLKTSFGGLSTITLQQAYNNSTSPEITTNVTLGGVQFKGGTGSDTDKNIIIENNSGVVTGYWRADGLLSATTFYGSGVGLVNIPISGVTNLQSSLASKFDITGGTITNNINVLGSVSATTFYGNGQYLTGLVTNDFYVTGGTFSGTTLILNRQNGSVTITGFTTTATGGGGTFNGGTVTGSTNFTGGLTANTINTPITNTQVIYSNSGTLTGSTNLTWSNSASLLTINGTLEATSKSFSIPHPTKEGKKLVYGSLEGPENGVYHRGKLYNEDTIILPEYWYKLVDKDTVTVHLTSIGKHQDLYIKQIFEDKVIIGIEGGLFTNKTINCYYVVYGERKDINKLEIER